MEGGPAMNEPYHLLYIDDDKMLLDIGKMYLERKEGFQVDVTTEPSVVLDSLEHGRYDAIISDYEMPVMNGIELLKAVREKDRSHPFILFTGRGREDVVIDALNNGADFYLQKGGEPKSQFAELAHKVRQAIMLKRTEQSLKTSVQELSKASTRYAALIAASHTGAWEYHGDTGYLWCSPEYFSMLGRDVSDYDLTGDKNIQETWTGLLHPEDRGSAIKAFDAYLNQPDGMYEQYFRMLHADGYYVWIWSRGRTILDEEGNPTSITVGTHIDITERKLAEESLKLVNSKLEWQTETLSILNHIITAVNKTQSLDELLQVFLDSTINLLRYDGGGIYLVNEENQTASLVYSKNLPDEFLNPLRTVSIHNPPFDSLFVWGKPLISDDYPAISRHAGQFRIQSIASIPIRAKDRIIGAFNIASYSSIKINDLDIRILDSVCAELGNSLLRMKTEEDLRQAYDTLQATDDELRGKNEQLTGVAATIPGAIFQFMAHPDEALTVTYISKRVVELFGYSGDTNDFFSFFNSRVDQQDRAAFDTSLRESLRSISPWRFEGRFTTPSEGSFWFEITSRPVHYGNLLTYNGVILDITDRKRAEINLEEKVRELQTAYDVIAQTGEELRANLEKLSVQDQALRESEEKFRTIFESAGDAIIILDNGVVYDCNHQAEELFRLPKVRLIGRSPEDLAPDLQPDGTRSRDLVEEKITAIKEGKPVSFEFVHTRQDGTEFFAEVTLQQIMMQGREFQQAIVRDISERKQAEFELLRKNEELATAYEEILSAESEAREGQQLLIRKDQELQHTKNQLDDIISFLPDATFVINRDGIVIAWNRAMEDLTGIAAGEILGRGDYEYAVPLYHEKHPILINLALSWDKTTADRYPFIIKTEHSLISEVFIPHFNGGSGLYLRLAACPFSDSDGNVTGAIESIRDITENKRAEEQLRCSYEQIAAAEEELQGNLEELTLQEQALRESEEKFRVLFESAGDAIIILDNGMIFDCNRRTEELFRRPRLELIGRSPADYAPVYQPDGTRSSEVADVKIQESQRGVPVSFEVVHLYPDGSEFFVEVTLQQIMMQGRVFQQAILRDVTERKMNDIALKYREDLYRRHARVLSDLIADTSLFSGDTTHAVRKITQSCSLLIPSRRVSVWLSDEDYTTIHCIDLFDPVTGSHTAGEELTSAEFPSYIKQLRKGEVIAARDVFSDPRTAELPASYYHAHDIRSLLDVPVWIRERIGGILSFEQTGGEQNWQPEEEVIATSMATFLSLVLEAGEYARMQADLQLYQEQLTEMTGMIPGLVFRFYARIDGNMGVSYISRHGCEIFGYTGDTYHFFEWFTSQVSPVDRGRFLRSVRNAVTDAKPWSFEGRFIRPSGDGIWFQGMSYPVQHESELVFHGILLDITERRQAEEAFQVANKKLNLLSSITRHDINNQLTGLCGYLDLIEAGTDLSADTFGYCSRAKEILTTIQHQIAFTGEYQDMGITPPEWQDVTAVIVKALIELKGRNVSVENTISDLFYLCRSACYQSVL